MSVTLGTLDTPVDPNTTVSTLEFDSTLTVAVSEGDLLTVGPEKVRFYASASATTSDSSVSVVPTQSGWALPAGTVVTDETSVPAPAPSGGGAPSFVSSVITAADTNEHATSHGLGVTPSVVILVPYGDGSPGAHQSTPADGTSVYVTCDDAPNAKYQIVAWI